MEKTNTFTLRNTFASLPRTTRGQAIVINGDPQGKNFLYCNGKQVFIRNMQDPSICDVYSQHAKETTVAKYSPSRFYIASGDKEGKVRVWDTVNEEHILKIEHMALGGPIKDIDWTFDNNRLCVVGEGRQTFGRCILWDSGSSAGDLSGHSKSINSVAARGARPMKVATASEDFTSAFHEGPPFKFTASKEDHTNFVNCVRYSPDGSKYITASSDGKLFIYDGITGELKGELGSKAHAGGIYSISFNDNGTRLASASGDKKVKIWDIEGNTCVGEFDMGNTVNDMQVSCLWQGDTIITVSLSGYINYLDPESVGVPKRIIKGHNKPITALAMSADGSRFYTGGSDSVIISWDSTSGENDDFKGKGHTNQVTDMVLDGDNLISVGIDDTIRFTPASSMQYQDAVKLDSQPRAVDSKNGITVVACVNHLVVFDGTRKASVLPVKYEAMSISVNPTATEVAVGCRTAVIVYSLSGGTLTETKTESLEDVSAISYSPDGAWLAVSSSKKVQIYNLTTWEEQLQSWGQHHTARVTCFSWSPDSRFLASGAVDAHIVLWDTLKFKGTKPMVKAHPLSHVNRLEWINNNTLLSCGQDSNIKVWNVAQ